MYPDQYKTTKIIQDKNLHHVFLCDIDGTIAEKGNRSPFSWNQVINDTPRENVVRLVNRLVNSGLEVIFFTGRDGNTECRKQTIEWIDTHLIVSKNYKLFMRKENDNRKDSIVKKEMFDLYIKDKYYVEFVLDDRDQVVKMWRYELGLDCLQVNYGDF
jgi:hydroxymethylpyrimidine pyrophosphatase-like HAD family hydrolase